MENQFKGTLSKLTYKKLFEEPVFCEANDSFQNSYDISDVNGKQICSISYQSNKDLGIGLNNQKEAEEMALLFSKAPEMLEMLESVLNLQKENYGNGMLTHLKMIVKAKEIEQLINSATKL